MAESDPIEVIYVAENASKKSKSDSTGSKDQETPPLDSRDTSLPDCPPNVVLRCLQCGFEFADKSLFKAHLLVHSESRPFKCRICYTRFKTKEDLLKHERKIHKRLRPYKCLKCVKVFNSIKVLKKHVLDDHDLASAQLRPEPLGVGEDASAKITNVSSFNAADKSDDDGARTASSATTLDTNVDRELIHQKGRDSITHKNSRQDDDHGSDNQESDSGSQDSDYDDESSLQKNLQGKSQMPTFQCPHCKETLANKLDLRRHFKRIHADLGKYPCMFCPQTFTNYSTLRYHSVRHTPDQTFKCKICGGTFKLKNTLRKHMLVHSNEKPFCCATCPARFKRKENLKQHTIIHFRSVLKRKA